MKTTDQFPLGNVIGVVAQSTDELDRAVDAGLSCVEIRADLLLDAGLSLVDIKAGVERTKQLGLRCLLTLRHPEHGGRFEGTEDERIEINRQALAWGADIIDLEWDTAAARTLLADPAPLILSYHNFDSMPDEAALDSLTREMCGLQPLAIKVVPTASSLADAARMLQWVKADSGSTVRRIGFAMGEAGACSRILTTAYGGPITYASFGDAVAPGQVALDDLVNQYRIERLNRASSVVAIIGSEDHCREQAGELNKQFIAANTNKVAIPFPGETLQSIEQHRQSLGISEVRRAG